MLSRFGRLIALLFVLSISVAAQKSEPATPAPTPAPVAAPVAAPVVSPPAPQIQQPAPQRVAPSKPDVLDIMKEFFWIIYVPAFVICFGGVYLANRLANGHGPLRFRRSSKEQLDALQKELAGYRRISDSKEK